MVLFLLVLPVLLISGLVELGKFSVLRRSGRTEFLAKESKHVCAQIGTWRHPTESDTVASCFGRLFSFGWSLRHSPAKCWTHSSMHRQVFPLKSKIAYFTALRDAVPELINIATGREARPLNWTSLPRRFRSLAKTRKGGGQRDDYFVTTICG